MLTGPARIGGPEGALTGRGVQRGRPPVSTPAPTGQSSAATRPGPIPSSPPAEVLKALDTAALVLEELASKQINLHFEVDDRTQQVRIQVTDGEGRVVREIPPTELAEIAAGSGPF